MVELPDVRARVYEALERERTIYPVHANRASEIGHPCLKYLVLLRTRWEELPLPPVQRLMIFKHGRIYETVARDYLEKAGFEVLEQGRPYHWKRYNITGKIDFKVALSRKMVIPVEVKGLNPYDFASIDTIEDFLSSKKHWLRKYPAQLTMYMLMDNVEVGLFFLINKVSFDFKPIWIHLDYTFGEELIQKAEAVNRHVQEGTVPAGIDDVEVCSRCDFLHVCLPEIKGNNDLQIIVDEELEEIIKRCEEIKHFASEYDKLSRLWKKKVEGKEKLIVGDYLVVGKEVERKAYTVEAGKYWKYKVLPLKEVKVEGEEA